MNIFVPNVRELSGFAKPLVPLSFGLLHLRRRLSSQLDRLVQGRDGRHAAGSSRVFVGEGDFGGRRGLQEYEGVGGVLLLERISGVPAVD